MYRKAALERLSSPEQLDQLLQVTNPRGWAALLALVLLILSAVLWGFYGSLPTEAQGSGILIRQGGVTDVVATGDGQIEAMLVAVGDSVRRGDVVARVRQDAQQRQVDDARERLAHARRENETLLRFSQQQEVLGTRDRSQRREHLIESRTTLENERQLLEQRLDVEQNLLDDGLLTPQAVIDRERELNQVRERLASVGLEIERLEIERLEAERSQRQEIEARDGEIRDLENEVRELEAQLEEHANIVAQQDGRVLELTGSRGDLVSPGTAVLSLEVVSEELIAVLFFPASQGKRVEVGMDARVAPSTVKREEFGYILGKVERVADFPSTRRGMLQLLSNEELVDELLADAPPLQIDVRLARDAATPSGFDWSSSAGPDLEITSGTLAGGTVVVEEHRPIHLVVPKLRELLGI